MQVQNNNSPWKRLLVVSLQDQLQKRSVEDIVAVLRDHLNDPRWALLTDSLRYHIRLPLLRSDWGGEE